MCNQLPYFQSSQPAELGLHSQELIHIHRIQIQPPEVEFVPQIPPQAATILCTQYSRRLVAFCCELKVLPSVCGLGAQPGSANKGGAHPADTRFHLNAGCMTVIFLGGNHRVVTYVRWLKPIYANQERKSATRRWSCDASRLIRRGESDLPLFRGQQTKDSPQDVFIQDFTVSWVVHSHWLNTNAGLAAAETVLDLS